MIKYLLVTLLYLSTYENLLGKERNSTVCYKRGVEVILPYEFGISKIKKKLTKTSNKLKNEAFILFYSDHAFIAHFLHRIRDLAADFGFAIGRDCTNLRHFIAIFHFARRRFD